LLPLCWNLWKSVGGADDGSESGMTSCNVIMREPIEGVTMIFGSRHNRMIALLRDNDIGGLRERGLKVIAVG
jgi:hypothetical protein